MARISLSPLIVDIRAKVADIVFSKWKGQNYVRSRVVPSNPQTPAQVAIREALAKAVLQWQTLLARLKLNWDFYQSGSGMSGFNAFIGANTIPIRDDTLEVMTKDNGWPSLTTFVASTGVGGGQIGLNWTVSPVPAGNQLIVIAIRRSDQKVNANVSFPAGTAQPQYLTGLGIGVPHRVYGFFAKTAFTSGDEVGVALESDATSS